MIPPTRKSRQTKCDYWTGAVWQEFSNVMSLPTCEHGEATQGTAASLSSQMQVLEP